MSSLSIKDLGDVLKFLGKRIQLDSDGYLLGQQAAIEELPQQHGLADTKGVCRPIGEEYNKADVPRSQLHFKSSTRGEPAVRDFQAVCCGSRAARGPTPALPCTRRRHDERASRP